MIKKYKGTLIFTSLTMLLPILVGLLLWDKLPEQVPFHWGINGEVDGWSSKTQAVFLMPCVMLAMHWLCVLVSHLDPKKVDYNKKSFLLVLWLCPAITLLISSLMYAKALGYDLKVNVIMPLLFGAMFLIIGNLLPKMRQNYTLGIKLPWTLHNEENWNKTHRFAGWMWTFCGVAIMLTGFLGSFWIFLPIALLMVIVPVLYSYLLHRKGL